MATDKASSSQRQFAMVPPIKVQSGTPSPLPPTMQHVSLPQLSQQRNVLTGGTPVPPVPLPPYCRPNELPNSFSCKQENPQTLPPCTLSLPHNGMYYLPDHSQNSEFTVPTGNPRLHRQGFSSNYLQIPSTHYHNPQSPTFSDISSIVLTSPRSPLLPPLPNLGDPFSKQPTNILHRKQTLQHLSGLSSTSGSNPDFDDTPTTPHLNSLSSYIPDISLGISPRQSARLTTRKRAFSTSPLSDLTEFNTLIRGSPNSLIPFYNQPQTLGHPAVSPNPLGGIGHLVGQISPVPPTQFTIKERKTSIEQNQNSEGTFNTTITNKITYTEHPIAQNAQPNLLLQTAEPMDVSPLLGPIHGSVKSASSTNSHYTDISSNDPVNCQWDICMQQFPCITDLVQHIEKTHIDKGIMEDYVCLWRNCPRNRKPFNARYKLVIHLRIHSGEKPNKCTHHGCNKAFSRLENLKIHMRTHTGEKPYICQIAGCHKSFSNSSDRSKHQKTHYEQKPFACTFPGCDKRYTDPSSLRKHTRNHSQRKKPRNEMSNKLDDCLLVQGLQNNIRPLDKKHHTGNNDKGHFQLPKVEVQPPSLIHVLSPQYPYQANTNNDHLHPPSPGFMISSPSSSTFYNTQDMTHCSPGNSNHIYLQNHSNSPYQSPRLAEFSPNMYNQPATQEFYIPNPKSPVMPSMSSPRPMMKIPLHTNVHSHPQSAYNHHYYNPTHLPTAQYIPNHLPPRYEDTQYMYYQTPLTTQQPGTLHHQDYSTIPTSSMYN